MPRQIEPTIEELEQGLRIDKNALDDALLSQSELYQRVSDWLALEISRRDAAKQSLSEVEAKVDLDIRKKFRDIRITEKEVDARKTLDSKVKEAAQIVLRLNYQVGRLTSLKESYRMRSHAISSLVELYQEGYYSGSENMSGRAKDMLAERVRAGRRAAYRDGRIIERNRSDGD